MNQPPPVGKRWKPGKSGNPKGRPRGVLHADIKNLTRSQWQELTNFLFFSTVKDVERIAKSKTLPVIQVSMAKIILKILKRGDARALDRILNRLIG